MDVDFSTVRLLLDLGANPRIQDNRGRLPRDWVAEYDEDLETRYDNLTRISRYVLYEM